MVMVVVLLPDIDASIALVARQKQCEDVKRRSLLSFPRRAMKGNL